MPPRLNSRYQYSRAFQDADDVWYLEVPRPFRFAAQKDDTPYYVTSGDTLHILAYRFFNGFPRPQRLWRAIAEYNDIIDATIPLVAGKLLIIPSLRWVNEVFLAPTVEFQNFIERIGVVS